jgi:hypothetical protein
MGNVTQLGEPIWYYEYHPIRDDTKRYSGIVRVVVETDRNGKQHLEIDDPGEASGKRNVNNVESEEFWDSRVELDKQNYWERADEGWTP